jgi:hypothetical protein
MTRYWIRENFTDEYDSEMAETAYVSGNPISGQELDAAQFARLDEPWRYAWDDEELYTLPARPVTDQAIRIGRDDECTYERLIIHYLQPHCPFVTRPNLTRGKEPDSFTDQSWDDIWMRLENEEVSLETVWNGYRENLGYVLDEIELLLKNVDAERTVISSDHGNAAGEWGLYGHPPHHEFDCLRTVPWVRTTARDENSHDPANERDDTDETRSVEDRLRALGYS